jgi:hypothetical protein
MRLTHRLDHDWQINPPRLNRLATWASGYPALDKPPDQIRSDIVSWDTPTSDAAVRPLLALAVSGDTDASRLLLVSLAGALAKTALCCPTQAAQNAFDDLVSQLAEVILVPHPLWSRAFADLAVRTTTRQWLNRTKSSAVVSFDETMATGSRNHADDLIETMVAEKMIGVLRRRYRLPGHTVTSLRLVAFYGETIGANERGPNAQAIRKQRQRALARVRGAA